LDNFAISSLAQDDPQLRKRFVAALHNGAELLFSIAHAVEIGGAKGACSASVKAFLAELGPHWYPVEFVVDMVIQREWKGEPPGRSCFAEELLKAFFSSRTSEYLPGCGKVIDLSEQFFGLGAFVDWLTPRRDETLADCRKLDKILSDAIGPLRAKAKRNPGWLDAVIPEPQFNSSKAATFVRNGLMRILISDRGYQLKKGDGIDFCHAVMAGAFASFATLDKQWKQRVENLPKPNKVARIFYEPELEAMVNAIEAQLETIHALRIGTSRA
jgi:hypothetical protein